MSRHLKPFLLLILAACGSDPLLERVESVSVTSGVLEIHTIFALPPFTDAPMPVYLAVANRGAVTDTLLAASSAAAESVIFHGGAMEMVEALPIPAGGRLLLRPGGLHLMLEPPLDRAYARGDSVAVTLRFARAGTVELWAPVVGYDEVEAVTERR